MPTSTIDTLTSGDGLVLFVEPADPEKTPPARKRQTYNTPSLIGNGLESSCLKAHTFSIRGSRLYDNGIVVGANAGVSNSLLVGSSNPGPVQTGFTISNGYIRWINSTFTRGEALFCVQSNQVFAVFVGSYPTSCTPVRIQARRQADLCPSGTSYTTLPGYGLSNSASTTLKPIVKSTSQAVTTTFTSLTSSATASTCAAGSGADDETVTVLPANNPSLDRTSTFNMFPSKYASLYYAESAPGTQVLYLEYEMIYPQVTLEDVSSITSVICSAGSMTLSFSSATAMNTVSQWPQSNLVMITRHASCNPNNQRGVYLASSWTKSTAANTITLQVTSRPWKDVAETMEIKYGQTMSSATSASSYTSTCTASYSHTATTAATTSTGTPSSSGGIKYEDLTPDEKAVLAWLLARTQFDADGNRIGKMPPAEDTTDIVVPTIDDPALQEQLEDALQKAKLSSPDTAFNKARNGLNGYCDASGNYVSATNKRSLNDLATYGTSPVSRGLVKRDDEDDPTWWKYMWEIGCSDLFGKILEAFSKGASTFLEVVCALKEIFDTVEEAYKNRAAIKCFLTGCWLDIPPTTVWDYTYSWKINFNGLQNRALTTSVRCVDCSMTVSEVKFVGNVKIILKTNTVVDAYMTYSTTSQANLVMGIKSTGPVSGNYVWALTTGTFKPVDVPGTFTIT